MNYALATHQNTCACETDTCAYKNPVLAFARKHGGAGNFKENDQ